MQETLEECSKHNCIVCNKRLESFMRANEKQEKQTIAEKPRKWDFGCC